MPVLQSRGAMSAAGGRSQIRATAIGTSAIVIWSSLALLTTWTSGLPPFELLSLTFAAAFFLSTIFLGLRGAWNFSHWRQPAAVWGLGVGGLFGYHFFYFLALGTSPVIEASLINYLWPLLIVLFSCLLPGERLRWFHVAGALMGLGGAAILILKPGYTGFDLRYLSGYAAAATAAVIWAAYSVANKRFAAVPSNVVSAYCGVVAGLAVLCHLMFEQTVSPNLTQWLAVLALGAGPVGLAFFLWDHGTKHGKIQILGAAAYAAPLLSTGLLILFGKAPASPKVGLACLLIVLGALLAGHDLLRVAVNPPRSKR